MKKSHSREFVNISTARKTFYKTLEKSINRNPKKLEFMGSSIHGTLCCSFPLSESYSYFDLYTHFCPFLLQFWYRLGFHCKSETSIQNRSYHPFTLQENILLLNTMGNIHVTCTPLSMLFTTWVSMFNRGIKRQVFGLSHVLLFWPTLVWQCSWTCKIAPSPRMNQWGWWPGDKKSPTV